MGKTELVNLYVEPGTKEEWTDYVEESDEATSVSHLIRKSVNRQIAGLYNPSGSGNTSGSETVGLSDDVITQLDRIEESLGELNNRVRVLEDEPDKSEYELQRAILALLPTLPPLDEMDEVDVIGEGEGVHPNEVEYSGTPEFEEYGMTIGQISNETGSTESDVEEAVEALQETTNEVTGVISGETGQRYIWRRH